MFCGWALEVIHYYFLNILKIIQVWEGPDYLPKGVNTKRSQESLLEADYHSLCFQNAYLHSFSNAHLHV